MKIEEKLDSGPVLASKEFALDKNAIHGDIEKKLSIMGANLLVENLNKFYRIGVAVDKSESAVAALGKFLRSPVSNYKKYRSLYKFNDIDLEAIAAGNRPLPDDVIWAVRNMNFEVPRGEVLGIIGHNGAGKSTLLKILSRITTPTQGRVEIRGRISSLLEVGTGFHNELTGRENTYLNGTILGMRKKEVDRVFDEIVDFFHHPLYHVLDLFTFLLNDLGWSPNDWFEYWSTKDEIALAKAFWPKGTRADWIWGFALPCLS